MCVTCVHAQCNAQLAASYTPHIVVVLCAVSQEFKYKNIAQEARHEQYLLHDPQMHNEYLSPKRNDGCLEDLEDVNKQASENDVLIPKLHNTFAQCLDASVSVLGGCPTFEVGFENVVNSHQVETTGRLKPDIVVVDSRYKHIKFGNANAMLVVSCIRWQICDVQSH